MTYRPAGLAAHKKLPRPIGLPQASEVQTLVILFRVPCGMRETSPLLTLIQTEYPQIRYSVALPPAPPAPPAPVPQGNLF